jgi:hypothetical protein
MISLLNAMSVSLKEHKQETEERKALKVKIDLALESIEKQWLSGQIILDDLILVLAVSRAEKAGFRHSREYHTAYERDENIIPRIKKAVIENKLHIYNDEMNCRENFYVIQRGMFPSKAKIFIKDFLYWQQEHKNLSIPKIIIDLLSPKDLIIRALIDIDSSVKDILQDDAQEKMAKAHAWHKVGHKFKNRRSFLYYWRKLG